MEKKDKVFVCGLTGDAVHVEGYRLPHRHMHVSRATCTFSMFAPCMRTDGIHTEMYACLYVSKNYTQQFRSQERR